jgi:hypothetical protein
VECPEKLQQDQDAVFRYFDIVTHNQQASMHIVKCKNCHKGCNGHSPRTPLVRPGHPSASPDPRLALQSTLVGKEQLRD